MRRTHVTSTQFHAYTRTRALAHVNVVSCMCVRTYTHVTTTLFRAPTGRLCMCAYVCIMPPSVTTVTEVSKVILTLRTWVRMCAYIDTRTRTLADL